MMQFLPRAVAALLLVGLAACSGSGEEEASGQSHEVQGGTKDRAHNYAVGIANKLGSVCSGTLIAPNLVLTARHCVEAPAASNAKKIVECTDRFRESTAPANLFVTTEPVIRGAKVLYAVADIVTPSSDTYCGNDIALLRLTKNIPAREAEPAIPVVQFSIGDARLTGKITALGYGITAPNAADPGTRRIRQKIDIICLPGDASYDCTQTIYASMMDNEREFITQGYVCSGDSGGGAFDQGSIASGTPYVLGALSRGPQSDTQCLAAIYSRTDKHADLIIRAAQHAAAAGGYAAPGWATGAAIVDPESAGAQEDGCDGDICTSTDGTDPTSEAPPMQTTITTTTTCSASPGTARTSAGALALFALVACAAVRRRRRA
ncbi:MAG: trypsin-like serine protease [Labilithrix sp.]|nr:trypsin-like serine protease [Labilithrix sp.]MCW5817552.1 trypsin-like serine protease [Labilithrix sp.]